MENSHPPGGTKKQKKFGCLQVIALMVVAVIITAVATVFVLKTYFFPSEFKPVTLNPAEEKVLSEKLENFDSIKGNGRLPQRAERLKQSGTHRIDPNATLTPEPYSEVGATREIAFTERELNALIAKNTDLAKKLAIDLSDNLISAKLLIPVDEDFPILGGKLLRFKSGMIFSYTNSRPVVILKGVSIMGVPVPNAWLGGIKNIDLVEKFGTDQGFWKTFSDGVRDVSIVEGRLKVRLKE